MSRGCLSFMCAGILSLLVWSPAYGQGSTGSSLSGVVLDSEGAVIPGATIVVKNNATNTMTETVSNSSGAFSVPALDPGVYTVSVSLAGFKTAIINEIRLQAAIPADLKVTLQVGGIEETVTVRGDTELVQTRSAAVSSTMSVDQIQNLPLPTRNAVNFATLLPGVNTTGVNRDSNFNGLPDSAVSITLDGVNNNENYNKSTEGLFAMITPRQDAVEAVTVTTATPGSESGGHGAVQIRMVTRAGTDKFAGSLYEYYRSPALNTNYYFNEIRGLGKNQVTLNQYGGRAGGPIIIPGVYNGRGKAFFFFNYEELRLPNDYSRTRNVLSPSAANGIFRYAVTEGGQQVIREVNLYALAAATGQTSTIDPTIASALSTIAAATAAGGTRRASPDPNMDYFDFLSPGNQYEKQPTTRIDYNLSAKHRLTGTYIWQVVDRTPDQLNSTDPRFPGMPNSRKYVSYRDLSSGALRSVLSGSIVNELRGGIKWGPSWFGKPEWNGPDTFSNQGGRALVLGNIIGGGTANNLTNIHTTNAPSARSAWSWNIDDTVNWQRGNHSVAYGGSYYEGYTWVTNQTMVPEVNFGVNSNDPANSAMFTAANFQGASGTQLGYARNLYALLTGRVTSIVADARLNEETNRYDLLGPRTQRLRQKEFGFFMQDTWRANSQLTLSGGVRWDLQLPIEPTNDIMSTASVEDLCGASGVSTDGSCNFQLRNAMSDHVPQYVQYDKGKPGYDTDWNNFAPSVGFAWRPGAQTGWLRRVLGDPEDATLRGGYSLAYNREGMALFTGVIGGNPGSTIPVRRDTQLGNLVPSGENWPLLLRDESRMGLPAFGTSPQYPIFATIVNDISIFDPKIEVSSAHSLTLGLQRGITRDMAAEVRYVGTWGRKTWEQADFNGNCTAGTACPNVNIVSNGFLDEFKRAQANLQANIAAGLGNTFAYTGAPGTVPLPIYLAYFSGVATNQAGNTANYSSALFRDTNFINQLARTNPLPYNHASDNTSYGLFGDATRRSNAIRAGLAPNFFIVNPAVDEALIYRSVGFTNYNALQLELRRRMSRGLQVMANYQYARGYEGNYLGEAAGYANDFRLTVPRHAIKMTWNYILPVGRERRFGGGMGRVADSILGGWEFHGSGRFQNRLLDFGNVRLVGMSLQELRDMYKVRYEVDATTGVKTVWMLPQDVILNTRRAFNVSATSSNGYSALGAPEGKYLAPANGPDCIQTVEGDCAPRHQYVFSPWFTRFDMSLVKKFALIGRSNFELRIDVMNVFDNVNFTPTAQTGTTATINQVTAAYQDNSNTFDPGGRLGQLGFRFSW